MSESKKRRTPEEQLEAVTAHAKRLRERVATGRDPQLAKDIRNVRKVQAAIEARASNLYTNDTDGHNLHTGALLDLETLVDRWVAEACPP